MNRERFIVAAGVIGLVVLTAVLLVGSLASLDTARIDSFQRSADRQKIIVNVTIGLGDEIAERSVEEDERTVRVTVRVRQPSGARELLGIPVPIVVSLRTPLDGRAVLDHEGKQVRDLGAYSAPGVTPKP
jgi:hypothetical protein